MLRLYEACLSCKYSFKQITITWEKKLQPIKSTLWENGLTVWKL